VKRGKLNASQKKRNRLRKEPRRDYSDSPLGMCLKKEKKGEHLDTLLEGKEGKPGGKNYLTWGGIHV